jgi:acyl dehydratase
MLMPLDYDRLMRMPAESVTQAYTKRDTILYALGLGVGAADPFDRNELKYVYERNLVALPTQAVVLGASVMRLSDPKFGVNYTMLLHGEQSLRIHKTLPPDGTIVSESKIDEIYDKGAAKGAVMYFTRKLFDKDSGDLLVTMGSVVFLRGDGGFGGKSDGAPKLRPVPADRAADLQVPVHTTLNQALIYRLSGDYNPLHIDPDVAGQAGFDRPILHGLAAYGMVGRALIKVLCNDEPQRMKRLDVRFTSPVFPGEPLHVDVWKIGAGDAAFKLVATQRGVVVEDFGRFEYQA